jgi:hypothetical protein
MNNKLFIKVQELLGKEEFPPIKCGVCNTVINPIDTCWLVSQWDNIYQIREQSKYTCSDRCTEMATLQLM